VPEIAFTVALRASFLAYMTLLLVHSLLQLWYAWQNARRQRDQTHSNRPGSAPNVDIVIPCLDEKPQLLEACCAAVLRCQREYPGMVKVFLVDDGSRQYERLHPVYQHYEALPNWRVIRQAHAGKRRAQDVAVQDGSGEIVVTVDSDTVLEAGALQAIADAFRDPETGAVTGNIGVSNHSENRLTRIIERQYDFLFGLERAAQSACDAVLCCAGPFAGYRRAALSLVWERYLNQKFLGMTCTTGDDIHLTHLIIGARFRSVYEPRAAARTQVPATVKQFLRQQLRWYRSFYRELRWIVPLLPRLQPYLYVDVLSRALVPLLLTLALLLSALELVGGHLGLFLHDLVPLGAMILTGAIFVIVRARNIRLVPIALLHAVLLLVARLQALLGLYKEHWGTRPPGVDLCEAELIARLTETNVTDDG
jgi:N-acetylglucosaminyltransferase